jgi:hypothetical protein
MSKFLEYLKLVPEGLKNLDLVVEGIVNDVKLAHDKLTEEEQNEIIRRRLICAACPFMSENAKVNPAVNYKSKRKDKHCTHCGCPISTKTAALKANCGIENYNARNPENPLPLKWEEYKPTNNE